MDPGKNQGWTRINTHSWVRISHGPNKFVMDLNNNDTESPEGQLGECALQLDAQDFACQAKAKAKPQRREPAGSSPRIVPIERRNWIDIEPGKYSLSEYEVSKKVIHLLRHSQKVHREDDGAVHFWRIKEHFQNPFPQSIHRSDSRWKACLAAGGGGAKMRFQYCTDDSGIIIYFRALQGHSGRNLIDPSLQDNAVIPDGFFKYIYHVGCAINLHSIINSGLISGGKISAGKDRQYPFCLLIPWTKNTRILTRSTWEHRVLHSTCIKHGRNIKTRCIGSISDLLKRKDWSSIRHDRTPSFFTKHSQLIVSRKLFGWKLEKSYTRKYMCHLDFLQRSPWNLIGWRKWVQKLLDKQKAPNQPNQTQIQIMIERGDPLWLDNQSVRPQRSTRRTSTSEYLDCHSQLWKQAENSRVRELVKKIENHPHRQDLQADLQQNNLYNQFCWKVQEDD